MILSVFNNTVGGGKSTLLYTFLIYLQALNKKRQLHLYDLYEDSILFEHHDSLKDIYKQIDSYSSLTQKDGMDIYNKFADFYQDKKSLHFFNTVGSVNNSHSMLLLYSKFIIIPVISSYYYLNNIHNFINLVNATYKNVFIPNDDIVGVVKEYPTLIFVPMHSTISLEIKSTLKNVQYGNGGSKLLFIDVVYPFLDYKKIIEYNLNVDPIDEINKSISNLIFSL